MIRKMSTMMLCMAMLFMVNTSFATTVHPLVQGVSVDYDLPPQNPQIFSNVFFWTVKASCTIITEMPESAIVIKALSKTGSVNDMHLSAGQTVSIAVRNGDKFTISAASGAKVELTNQGEKNIVARCTTV
ncbi:hypothetical protein [Legionella oakridgensis]|uniref:hypothetical protein n=1 Tax=Legionella oakridgensis TaxID=29423 RepID=UPI0003DE5665|nr:hypothetical protein [Legionella oakridgensis]ETO93531.1 hypothetical protein LOR_69c19680 [Legionella oakridgensis RV-2-2007]